MMKIFLTALVCLTGIAAEVAAQAPFAAMDEHAVLKQDVGQWHAKGKMFVPGVEEAIEFEGTETNEMVGVLWCITDFTGDFAGTKFRGHGRMGYNPATKKYEGTWFDSTSPHAMSMSGTYDKASKTFTMLTEGIDESGDPRSGKTTLVYQGTDTRIMTAYRSVDGKMLKEMEITYTRKK